MINATRLPFGRGEPGPGAAHAGTGRRATVPKGQRTQRLLFTGHQPQCNVFSTVPVVKMAPIANAGSRQYDRHTRSHDVSGSPTRVSGYSGGLRPVLRPQTQLWAFVGAQDVIFGLLGVTNNNGTTIMTTKGDVRRGRNKAAMVQASCPPAGHVVLDFDRDLQPFFRCVFVFDTF